MLKLRLNKERCDEDVEYDCLADPEEMTDKEFYANLGEEVGEH